MSRQVLLSTNCIPGTGANLSSVLRTAVGLKALYRGHQVEVVLLGDAVVCGLSKANPPWVGRYLRSAKVHEIPVFVEKESLEARKWSADDLAVEATPLDVKAYLQKWQDADIQLRI